MGVVEEGTNILKVHTYPQCDPPQAGNATPEEAIPAFESPCLVGVVQKRLPVICDGLPIATDNQGRVVILG